MTAQKVLDRFHATAHEMNVLKNIVTNLTCNQSNNSTFWGNMFISSLAERLMRKLIPPSTRLRLILLLLRKPISTLAKM